MKNHFDIRTSSIDAKAINETIQRALSSAGLDTTSGPMHSVIETIKRALASAGLSDAVRSAPASESVVDAVARVGEPTDDIESVSWPASEKPNATGTFQTFEFSNQFGTRSYKLYVPSQITNTPPAMMVMLHGCTQSADDFARGTQMNRLAESHGFLVVYPEQAGHANSSKCWNWFKAQDQMRDAGEPALIAGIVHDVAARHGVDGRRIFVAGLSSGAAMAVIMGETYPELFAGVGAHSGLPYGSAHDIPSAMAAMKGGRGRPSSLNGLLGTQPALRKGLVQAIPTIVFHGDRDHTVRQTNGSEIVRQANGAYLARSGDVALLTRTQCDTASGGRSYTREIHADGSGQAHIECWTLHGAGHAWSGGNASGSYTDGTGPDASAEIVRFFLSLPRAGSA